MAAYINAIFPYLSVNLYVQTDYGGASLSLVR
jgi:hypothetical protein